MKKQQAIVGGAWGISILAAFFLGQSISKDSASTQMDGGNQSHPHAIIRDERATREAGNHPLSRQSSLRHSSLSSIAEDFPELIANMVNIISPIERERALLEMIRNLSPGDFERAYEAISQNETFRQTYRNWERLFKAGWAKVDPLGALSYGKQKKGFDSFYVIMYWAQESPQQALAWARENSDPEGQDSFSHLIGSMVIGIVETDLDLATTLLQEVPDALEKEVIFSRILQGMREKGMGIDDSKQLISNLEDKALQADAASDMAREIAKDDPKEAFNWVSSLGEEALKRSADSIAESWGRVDLTEAKDWADQQSNDIRAIAARSLVGKMDPAEASSWLSNYEGDSAYDKAIENFARSNIEKTPELSADWIMKITNKLRRNHVFNREIKDWYKKDPEGLINYAQNNAIPDETLFRLNLMIEKENGG